MQMRKFNARAQVLNRASRNLLKRDPTRTQTLRRVFAADINRRFAKIEKALVALVQDENAFNLVVNASPADQLAQARKDTNPHPTPEQIKAGNYRKGKFWLHGLEIAIENPKGSTRSGIDATVKRWSTKMANDYGYIKGVGKSEADQQHVDVFLGSDLGSDLAFVVDQTKAPAFKVFDESKVMLGFLNTTEAKAAYLANYGKGWQGFAA